MTPLEFAAAHCAEKGIDLARLFGNYLTNPTGYFVSLPHIFAMGRPVDFGQGRQGWMIDLAAGELKALLPLIPFDMPYVGFYRDNTGPLKVYPLARFKQLMGRTIT